MSENLEIGKKIRALREGAGLTQLEFAKQLQGVSRGAVANWERGQGIKRENLAQIAEKYGKSLDWFVGRALDHDGADVLPNATIGAKMEGPNHLIPLYGQAVGGEDGEFVLNGNKLADIVAPPALSSVRGAYAALVSGDSMEPRYFDGEMVYVDPSRRPRRGDFVVAQVQLNEHGPILAYVKRFVRWNDLELVLEQYNPLKELRFPHGCVVSVHFIVMGGAG